MIEQIRIDEKLINGSVTENAMKGLNINMLLIVDDASASDDLVKKMLLMQAPTGIKTQIRGLEETIRLLQDPRAEKLKILAICKTAQTALKLTEAIGAQEINAAKCKKRKAKEKIELNDNWAVEPNEIEVYDRLYELTNGNVFSQYLPTYERDDYKALLAKAQK